MVDGRRHCRPYRGYGTGAAEYVICSGMTKSLLWAASAFVHTLLRHLDRYTGASVWSIFGIRRSRHLLR